MWMILFYFVKIKVNYNPSLKSYDDTFSRFGLTIANDKTKTLSYNVPEEVMASSSLITLTGEPIENVRQFKYLGHMLSNESSTSSNSKYLFEMERIKIHTAGQTNIFICKTFLEACMRSRLLYSVQAWQLNASEMQKISESVWHRFLRRMVKGRFKRENAPKNKNDTSIPADELIGRLI